MRLALQRNPLDFPCGLAPGFDPTHVAAVNPILSMIALTGGAVNIMTGVPGVNLGAPTSVINGSIGPATLYVANADTTHFPVPTTNFQAITMAVIIMPTAIAAVRQSLIQLSSANSGWHFYLGIPGGGGNVAVANDGATERMSGLFLSANVPYFVVLSANTATANFLVKNLQTGSRSIWRHWCRP
jgi:hypothetical protein